MLELNVGDRFIATDRLGRNSTWELIKKKDDIHFLLEACGETLKKCERDYLQSLKGKGNIIVNPNRKRTTKKDFCTNYYFSIFVFLCYLSFVPLSS